MKNDILKKMMLCFCCLLLCFNLSTKNVKADSSSLSSNLKYWVVCVVLALAGGVKVGSDLTEAQLTKFKDKAVSYYKDLADNFGDRLSGMFTWSNALAVIAGTATSLITGDTVKGGISMKWINNNIAELKKIADKWISDLTSDTTFNPSNDMVKAPDNIRDFFSYKDKRIIIYGASKGYFESLLFDSFENVYPIHEGETQEKYIERLKGYVKSELSSFESSQYFNYIDFVRQTAHLNMYHSILELIYHKYGYQALKKSGNYFKLVTVSNGKKFKRYISLYINDVYIDLKKEFSYESSDLLICSYSSNQDNFGPATHLSIPDVNYKLDDKIYSPTLDNKHKTLDNIKDYTDNLNNVDKLVYVKPDTLSIDNVGDKTIVSDPGVIGLPFPLPSDWTQPADKPYTGVDGKTHDPTKVLDPTKPWADDKTKPVSIPSDPTIDLPYDDVKDRADPKVLDPDITTPRDDPKDIDVPDTTVNPTDSYKDWHKIFPFCIPWDIEALLSFLVAEPKAPSYTFDLGSTITSNKQAKNISFDLSQYDDQAKIIRNLEMILFAVGLLLLTRYIIKG